MWSQDTEIKQKCEQAHLNVETLYKYLWVRKKNLIVSKKVVKFMEAFWRFLMYAVFCAIGYYTLFVPTVAPWILDTNQHWDQWPSHQITVNHPDESDKFEPYILSNLHKKQNTTLLSPSHSFAFSRPSLQTQPSPHHPLTLISPFAYSPPWNFIITYNWAVISINCYGPKYREVMRWKWSYIIWLRFCCWCFRS